ncbi:serum paraoxonase/arylesterase 2-like [Xenia sp. Carnegie-2017]|uniref:serum paraoxonase/arylesterase 2-like n=1 Tax=Xenia sp. Carnegie-2017 TaxID=2897299 RepID=UPI001F047318|nr:serum paraoxonase/arylesterase 2-like [Xenia sp. Carnegie-2017]
MGVIKQVLVIAFSAWLLLRIIALNRSLRIGRFGLSFYNHNPGPCKIFHVNGSEDIVLLPNGLAIFSSGLDFTFSPTGPDPATKNFIGMLYSFDLNNPDHSPQPLKFDNFHSKFTPHGIDLYIDPQSGEVSLFVVNHGNDNKSIEIFMLDMTKMVLKHKRTVFDEKIYSPNDLVAVGPESFYVTNDRYFINTWLLAVETTYPLKLCSVVYYDGKQSKYVASNLNLANGINMDLSEKYIFVASGSDGEVIVFERDINNNLLKRQHIQVGVLLDNINVDEEGHLWLGVAHFDFVAYSSNFTRPCPGAVLQVRLSKSGNPEVPFNVDDIREVFGNDGKGQVKCVSSGLFYRGKMLVGNPFSSFVYCKVNEF